MSKIDNTITQELLRLIRLKPVCVYGQLSKIQWSLLPHVPNLWFCSFSQWLSFVIFISISLLPDPGEITKTNKTSPLPPRSSRSGGRQDKHLNKWELKGIGNVWQRDLVSWTFDVARSRWGMIRTRWGEATCASQRIGLEL